MKFSLFLSLLFASSASAWTLYDILLVDLFGDGWRNIYLNVMTDGETKNYTMDCSCSLITINTTSNMVTINVTSDGTPIAPWEILWVANITGEVFVGDFDSSMYIDGDFVSTMNPVSYNVDGNENSCKECKHPPPKHGRALAHASPSPPPPALVIAELYSATGNAWYNAEGGWTGVCDAALSKDVIDVPDVLTYPKFFIMNEDKTKVLQKGTVCDDRETEFCEEPLPHHGNFVFRATGYSTDATWKFCGEEGSVNEELVFSMKAGKCEAKVKHTAADYCTGILSYMIMLGELAISDVKGDTLSAYDTKMLEQQITSMFTHQREVTIVSYTYDQASSTMMVSFKATIAAEDYGVDGTVHSDVEDLASAITSSVSSPVTEGQFMTSLLNMLKGSPLGTSDVLSSMSAVSLSSLSLSSISYGTRNADTPVSAPVQEETETIEVATARKESVISATVGYICGAVALVAIIAFAVVRTSAQSENSTKNHLPLPLDSVHNDAHFEVEDDSIPQFDLAKGRKTEKSYFKSSERV
jgi:hypothetical protein